MASRDEYTDSSRTGPPKSRESCMKDCDFRVTTLAEEKLANPDSVGTAGDSAGITTEANKASVRRR